MFIACDVLYMKVAETPETEWSYIPNSVPNKQDLITKWNNSKLGLSYFES